MRNVNALPMTPDEIVTSYRAAANKPHQITVLADLNMCSRLEMREILVALGVLDGTAESEGKLDKALALKLYQEKKNDREIGEACGVTPASIAYWRNKEGLPPNVKPGNPKAKRKPGQTKPPMGPGAEMAALTGETEPERPAPEPVKAPLDPVEAVLGGPAALSCGVLVEMLRFLPEDRVVLVDGSPVVRAEMRGGLTGPRLQLYTERGVTHG